VQNQGGSGVADKHACSHIPWRLAAKNFSAAAQCGYVCKVVESGLGESGVASYPQHLVRDPVVGGLRGEAEHSQRCGFAFASGCAFVSSSARVRVGGRGFWSVKGELSVGAEFGRLWGTGVGDVVGFGWVGAQRRDPRAGVTAA
jgi:hypothetical protein